MTISKEDRDRLAGLCEQAMPGEWVLGAQKGGE